MRRLVLACTWLAEAQSALEKVTAITGARLIDGTGAAPIDDSVVLTEGDRIRAAGPRAKVAVPHGSTMVDAKGKFVMPGLVDVHCHINVDQESMKQGIPVVAHVTDVPTLYQLGDLGVTDFLHNPRDPVTPELIAYAKSKGLSFAPTLANGESGYYLGRIHRVMHAGRWVN